MSLGTLAMRAAGVAAIATAMLAGCASSNSADEPHASRLMLEMFLRDATNAEKLFRVEDGELHFGGGLDARLRQTTWSTPLSDHDLTAIADAIDRVGWPRTKPAFSGEPEEQFWRISVRTQRGFARFKGRGRSDAAQQVHDVLDSIALRRLDRDLERLPKPGPVAR